MDENDSNGQDQGDAAREESNEEPDGLQPASPRPIDPRLSIAHDLSGDGAADYVFPESSGDLGDSNVPGSVNLPATDVDINDSSLDFASLTSDVPQRPTAARGVTIDDAILRPAERAAVQSGPYIPGQDSDRAPIQQLAMSEDRACAENARAVDIASPPRDDASPEPTPDSEPLLALPIVIVMLAAEQQQRIREEALAAAARRDAQVVGGIAEEKVNHAFWIRDCEQRAVWVDP